MLHNLWKMVTFSVWNRRQWIFNNDDNLLRQREGEREREKGGENMESSQIEY